MLVCNKYFVDTNLSLKFINECYKSRFQLETKITTTAQNPPTPTYLTTRIDNPEGDKYSIINCILVKMYENKIMSIQISVKIKLTRKLIDLPTP